MVVFQLSRGKRILVTDRDACAMTLHINIQRMYMLHRNVNRSEVLSLIFSSTIHRVFSICYTIFYLIAAVVFACFQSYDI
jgi:hypothetical protein